MLSLFYCQRNLRAFGDVCYLDKKYLCIGRLKPYIYKAAIPSKELKYLNDVYFKKNSPDLQISTKFGTWYLSSESQMKCQAPFLKKNDL